MIVISKTPDTKFNWFLGLKWVIKNVFFFSCYTFLSISSQCSFLIT